jgi:hypothetical protein
MRLSLVLASAGIALATACVAAGSQGLADRPCVRWSRALRPLLIGDSARITTGRMRESDCLERTGDQFTWSSLDTAVATVRPNGWVVGRAAGRFRAVAREDTTLLVEEGFVLPAGWTLRIQPDSATIQLGDTARFEVRALALDGTVLPPVPYSLYTAEFDVHPDSGPRPPPPVDKWSHQGVTGSASFIGERRGRTVLRGELGTQRVHAPLTVESRTPAPRGLTLR